MFGKHVFLIAAVLLTLLISYGNAKLALGAQDGDILCRFYTNKIKFCQNECVDLTPAEVENVLRNRESDTTFVSEREIKSQSTDPILMVKCIDDPISSTWDMKQGFQSFQGGMEFSKAVQDRSLYVGSCLFKSDTQSSWVCGECERAYVPPISSIAKSCFQSDSPLIYQDGWYRTKGGSMFGSLSVPVVQLM